MSTIYFSFGGKKTRLETVLHTLLVCESQRSLLSLVIPERRFSNTWSIFALFRTSASGKGDNWCFWLVVIFLDLVLIRLMIMWLLSHEYGYCHTWPRLSCILLLICELLFFSPDVCSVVSSANTSQSTDIFLTCNGRSLIKILKTTGPKTEPCGTLNFIQPFTQKPWSKTRCILSSRYVLKYGPACVFKINGELVQ